MTIPFVDLKQQYSLIKPKIQERINRVLDHGQYIMGPEIQELEEQLEEFTGAKYCISVASGTDALLISLMALGIKAGDEVITTPFSFASTAEVIVLLGATPIFVDIEADTCNIDASLIEEKITKKTKAIMPVSLFGQPADMTAINSIAAKYGNIPVIEDAAQSFGALYEGKKSTNLSTIGCTSFFPSKPLGCYGDAGAIFTNDREIAIACKEIRVHGQSSRYVHKRVGIGGRMDTIQAAILLAKLEIFDVELQQRFAVGARYNALIDEIGLDRIVQRQNRRSTFAQFTIYVERRESVVKKLQAFNIPTSVHYPIPLNCQKAYKKLDSDTATPWSKLASDRVLSLPMHPYLSLDQQLNIISTLKRII